MILILSIYNDPSTDAVIDWINYLSKKEVVRLNGEDIFNVNSSDSFEISNSDISLNLKVNKNITISHKQIDSIWYRRDSNSFVSTVNELPISEKDNSIYKNLNSIMRNEYMFCKRGLFSLLENNKLVLGNYKSLTLNKIETLFQAYSLGIDIPSTIITSSKIELKNFISKYPHVITKSIHEAIDLKVEVNNNLDTYISYTEEVTPDILEKIPDNFFPSLLQEKLDKDIEIRVFYLDEKFYSMAIFSQLDKQTSVDFRKYNSMVNNRNVPYKLPNAIENKLKDLMNKLDLNTGSIDIVKTVDGRFVFLEVNPVGQYGMTSTPCNYFLDKKIAEFLICN